MDRKEKAVGYFHSGCNCCQAVLCAFTDEQHAEEMKSWELHSGSEWATWKEHAEH